MVGGAIKSASQLVGNTLDMLGRYWEKAPNTWAMKYKASNPNASDDEVNEAYKAQLKPSLDQSVVEHTKDAANWLRSGDQPQGFWENIGAIGEQTIEYLGLDGVTKLVGEAGGAAEGIDAATRTGEALKNAQQITQTLAKNPKLAGLMAVGLKAAKDAALLGGQTYAHTEDPEQAALAAGTAGVLRTGGEAVSAAARCVERIAPRTAQHRRRRHARRSRRRSTKTGKRWKAAAEARAVADAQQEAAPKVIQNVAQSAARSALEKINATRPAIANAIEDPARQLAAPEGSQPFKFTLGGPPTTETPVGEIAHPAGKVGQPAANPPKYTTASGPKPIDGSVGSSGADISTAGVPGPRGETVGGGGQVQTTDPAEAESWLSQLEQVQQSKIYESMPKAQQDAIEAQREQLSQQLSLYHASPYAKRFDPVDIEGSLGYVRNFGDAADQIQASAKPIYAQLDRASGGDFTKWNGQAKQALKIMRSATSVEAYEGAEQRYQQATGEIDNLITRHAGDVSQADYQAARSAWRDSSRLDELHAVMERMTNGITSEESEQGLTRVMTGRTKALEAYLAKGTNRAQLEGLIGTDGVTNLKQLTQLLSKPSTTRAVAGVLRNSFASMGGTLRVGAGGWASAMVAHMLGLPWYEGVAAGAVTTEGMRAIMRDAMVNPRIGTLVDFAARNGVDPKIYAPLIARAIVVPLEEQPNDDGEENTQQ